MNGNCGGWATNGIGPGPTVGHTMGGLGRFTSSDIGGRVSERAFICFGIDRQAVVEPPAETGRIALVTETNVAKAAGVPAFDAQCSTEAVAAGFA